jgi:hypothetical protein
MIVATAVRIAMMTVATAAMTAKIGAADPGYCGDSYMRAPTPKRWPSRRCRVRHELIGR